LHFVEPLKQCLESFAFVDFFFVHRQSGRYVRQLETVIGLDFPRGKFFQSHGFEVLRLTANINVQSDMKKAPPVKTRLASS
jgi:very-short-patch-repair endonuclease